MWGYPVHDVFSSHLRKNLLCIPGEVEDMDSEWAIFKAFIMVAAARSCGQRVVMPVVVTTKERAGGHQ